MLCDAEHVSNPAGASRLAATVRAAQHVVLEAIRMAAHG
jgi:hypothetical protein